MRAPLYVEGGIGCKVSWEEPALCCVLPNKAEQFFPLARISRVVVLGECAFELAALLACADLGICVLFLADSGELRAKLLGRVTDRQGFVQRLSDVLSRADGYELYANWYAAMEKMAVRSAARRLKLLDWQEVSVSYLQAYFRHFAETEYSIWRGLLTGQVVSTLASFGLDAECEDLQTWRLDLVTDVVNLLAWDLRVALFKSPSLPMDTLGWLDFYQQRTERVDRLLNGTLNRLHQWLVGLF